MKLAKFVKHGLCIFTSIAVMGTLAGCGGQAGSMNKGKLVKIAVCVSSQTPASMAMREVFKPRLEELTEGKYDIQIYDSGVLGSEKVTYDYTKSGIIEMCVVGTPMWSETPVMIFHLCFGMWSMPEDVTRGSWEVILQKSWRQSSR